MKTIYVADLFCGGGGTSTGMINAFIKHKIQYELIGINHWQIAIDTNQLNHKGNYYRASVENVKPREKVPGGRLHFLWASPECTNHSNAKGGRPKDEQSRATAWDILKWAQELYIDRIYIENVKEFLNWGPIDTKGQPIKSKKGETFRAFINVIESLGYTVDYQIMNAADFGAPTSRRRLIIQAVRGRNKIIWPEPTHAANPDNLFGQKPYVPAKDIIDWSISGKSIFTRKKPLKENTLRRIEAGIKKYWGPWAESFLVILRGQSKCRDINSPVPTISCSGAHLGLVQPFLTKLRGTGTTADVEKPLPTITAGGNHLGVVEPFITRYNGGDDRNHSIDKPLPVVDTSNRYGVVEPIVIATGHTSAKNRSRSINEPLSTIVTKEEHYLVEPLILDMSHPKEQLDSRVYSAKEPLKTITTRNNMAVVEPLILHQMNGMNCISCNKPLPTITTVCGHALIEPFLVKYNGNEHNAQNIDEPLDTVTTKERFAIVNGCPYKLDILYRMLQPHELAAAMSFPKTYKFVGNREAKVKQIGNAVPPVLAEALIDAALSA